MSKELILTAAAAAVLISAPYACAPSNDWDEGQRAQSDTAVCVNSEGQRVEDYRCDDGRYGGSGSSNGFLWYYLGRNSALPYYGDNVRDSRYAAGGSYTPRPGASYSRAPVSTAMTRSAAVSRGGLGSSSRFFGGGRS